MRCPESMGTGTLPNSIPIVSNEPVDSLAFWMNSVGWSKTMQECTFHEIAKLLQAVERPADIPLTKMKKMMMKNKRTEKTKKKRRR